MSAGRPQSELSIIEEILLLELDDASGRFSSIPDLSRNYAISGAVLMDLALRDRIDSDLEGLMVVDTTPTGDDILDPVLSELAKSPEKQAARHWINEFALDAQRIRERALTRLVGRGVLKEEAGKFLWIFGTRRYPAIDGKEMKEVKLRILGVLLNDDIPDPRDIVLICLADAYKLFDSILSQKELDRAADRIALVRKMDLVGQAVTRAVKDIKAAIAQSYFAM